MDLQPSKEFLRVDTFEETQTLWSNQKELPFRLHMNWFLGQ